MKVFEIKEINIKDGQLDKMSFLKMFSQQNWFKERNILNNKMKFRNLYVYNLTRAMVQENDILDVYSFRESS